MSNEDAFAIMAVYPIHDCIAHFREVIRTHEKEHSHAISCFRQLDRANAENLRLRKELEALRVAAKV